MPLGFLFWLIMILVALFGLFGYNYEGPYRNRIFGGWGLLVFVLFFIVGWRVFGFVIVNQ